MQSYLLNHGNFDVVNQSSVISQHTFRKGFSVPHYTFIQYILITDITNVRCKIVYWSLKWVFGNKMFRYSDLNILNEYNPESSINQLTSI